MTQKYREDKRKREARQKAVAKEMADNPLADTMAEFVQLNDRSQITESPFAFVKEEAEIEFTPDGLPITPVGEVPETIEPIEEKGIGGASYYRPFGGAMSFDELEKYLETQEEIEHYESVTYMFRSIINNVLANDNVQYDSKAAMIKAAAEVYKMKLTSREKSFVERLKEFFGQKEKLDTLSSMEVIKTKDGVFRWYGWYTNNYEDREGEILSAEAHKEFLAYLKENPDRYPLFRSWHLPGTDRSQAADFVEYFDGFLVASGPLTAKEAEQLEKAIAYDDGQTGMSHGFFALQRDPENPNVITKYRTFEISDLPLANAANGFTGINSTKEVNMTDEKLERLSATIGEEAAKLVVDQIGNSKEVLDTLGVESKEDEVVEDEVAEEEEVVEEEEKEVEESEEAEEVEDEEKEIDPSIKEIALAVAKAIDLPALSDLLKDQNQAIEAVKKDVEELKKDDDTKIAEQVADHSLGALLWKRPSESAETEIDADADEVKEIVKESQPSWVTEVFNPKEV